MKCWYLSQYLLCMSMPTIAFEVMSSLSNLKDVIFQFLKCPSSANLSILIWPIWYGHVWSTSCHTCWCGSYTSPIVQIP